TVSTLPGLVLLLMLLTGCSVLPGPPPQATEQYTLEYTADPQIAAAPGNGATVLIVSAPRAHGGYDSARIAYMEKAYGLRYYTRSRWAATPARMLAPLLADAIQETGRFQALHRPPGSVAADMRLDTELIRFHQDFTVQPSVMRVTLRAQLVDLQAGRVLATRLFDVRQVAATEDAYGGVVAANHAVQQLLQELAQFCVDHQP
ncbi:MAG: ABC-type transport auxiliary lipoprotein family protein, partial [Gammaproteobacteria bacterium]|nr:ABC-type transport auxiliary lipoprotein family protein [Gammaproteobacteria bacterium]